jgi:hypothetical protein
MAKVGSFQTENCPTMDVESGNFAWNLDPRAKIDVIIRRIT